MELIIIVSGAVGGRLTGSIKTNRNIKEHGGGSVAFDETNSIVDGFDGGAGLAKTGGDVDVAIDVKIKVVFRANHGKDFTGAGFSDQGSSIGDASFFEFSGFGSDDILSMFLDIKIKRGGNAEAAFFHKLLTILVN